MSGNTTLDQDCSKLLSFREGANYIKMDLHTHSPASECSSFALPKVMSDIFPKKGDKQKKYLEFLENLAAEKDLFGNAYKSPAIKNRPYLGDAPELDLKILKAIADEWLEDIAELGEPEVIKKDKELKRQQKSFINDAIRDVTNYLCSLFFPGEYVLRAYIEELQIMALTDHNHPGYIVPRLPKVGTWFSHLKVVNDRFVDDIYDEKKPGEKVRQVVLERLKLAKERLEKDYYGISHAILVKEHKEKGLKKALKEKGERLEYVKQRIDYWEKPDNQPGRLQLFPGVEFTVSNVHMLSVFPPSWYVPGRIGSILRTVGIPEEQWGKGFIAAASSSVQDLMGLVHHEGGIAIPAHSNSDFKGLLRLFKKGIALNKVLEHDALLALESIGGTVIAGDGKKRGKDECKTLKWLEEGSFRPQRSQRLTFVKGSDAHECRIELDGTGEDMGRRFTYIKMDFRRRDTDEEVFRSLRLGLMAGYSRIIEYPPEATYNYSGSKKDFCIPKDERMQLLASKYHRPTIMGMTVSGKSSYARDIEVRFNPYLNCVVGSAGKSTLVRTVAYGFNAFPFMEDTPDWWLPELIRVYWYMEDRYFCMERNLAKGNKVCWFEFKNKTWQQIDAWNGITDQETHKLVQVWPPSSDDLKVNFKNEDEWMDHLEEHLKLRGVDGLEARPILVNQPKDIFNSKKIFDAVLSKPLLKTRQIIWSTGSPNVPASMDAEKIIVTGEKKSSRKRKQMEIICAGDLHEDEIRQQFLNQFEGGWSGFARRNALYTS